MVETPDPHDAFSFAAFSRLLVVDGA